MPPSKALSSEDRRGFDKELERLNNLLSFANDKPAVQLQIANTYAAGGQYAEAMKWLRRLIEGNFGFDPSRDPDFNALGNTREFQSLMEEVRRQTPPVSNSRFITAIDRRDLFPENFAFDGRRNEYFAGSTARDEIVRCSPGKGCTAFAASPIEGHAYLLGMKIDAGSGLLWATVNTDAGASLRGYDLETGKLERTAQLAGKHLFNDLAISSAEAVFVTDTAEGSVYQLRPGDVLRKTAPEHVFLAANGIAISPDDKLLYVSAWGDGIEVVDLRTDSARPIDHPDDLSLAFIDGLYWLDGNLIAIQNGPMLPRIVAFKLDKSGRRIERMIVRERRNPLFDGLTTGAIVGRDLYYIANSQIDKKGSANLEPLQILAVQAVP